MREGDAGGRGVDGCLAVRGRGGAPLTEPCRQGGVGVHRWPLLAGKGRVGVHRRLAACRQEGEGFTVCGCLAGRGFGCTPSRVLAGKERPLATNHFCLPARNFGLHGIESCLPARNFG